MGMSNRKQVKRMPEHQTIEWKELWHDEFLEWICGYANAYGGTLYIGKNDNGDVVGLRDKDRKKLLESIPNKITDTMGIVADVNLLYENDLQYIEIIVDKYPSLISYHGKEAIDLLKEKAIRRGRLTEEETRVDDTILMENLHLIDEDGYLIRAAMLAFYKDPEKWVTGSYIKIGYFGDSDADLRYQDEIHGSLIEQVDKAVDLVYTKYLKALIFYDGIQRVEQFMFHQDAFREILLNAIVHKDYSSCNPIQISVYEDKIYIWNDGEMPSELNSADKLFMKHSSKPYNPKLAGIFFKSGMIEAWGRGFDKIREACAKYDAPLPEYNISASGIMVLCKACDKYLKLLNSKKDTHLVHFDQDNDQDVTKMIIAFCKQPHSAKEIMDYIRISDRSFFRRHYLNPMMNTGKLKMTIPDKPKSGNQKYYAE